MKQYSVYFAERSGLIKIGCSSDPERRCRELKAKLLGYLNGAFKKEKALHRRFAEFRKKGEWFMDCAAIREFAAQELTMKPIAGQQAAAGNVYFADEAVKERVKDLAAHERRSFSAMVQILLEEALDARSRPDPLGEALNSRTGGYKP